MSVALLGETVTVMVSVSPSTKDSVAGESDTLVTGTAFSFTVTAHVAVFAPSTVVTVMVALPAATAVTTPLSLTVATDSLSELHVTLLFVAFDGETVAVSAAVPPMFRLTVSGDRLTPVTAITLLLTVTVHVAFFPPQVAVIVALPAFTAVTTPFWSTVATDFFEVVQVTVLSVALSGLTVAVRVPVSPSVNVRLFFDIVTEVTGTSGTSDSVTVTAQAAFLFPSTVVAVMVA